MGVISSDVKQELDLDRRLTDGCSCGRICGRICALVVVVLNGDDWHIHSHCERICGRISIRICGRI